MKKIIILSEWYAPGFKAGGPVQSCVNLVNELSGDFELYVLTTDRDLGDTQPYANLKLNEWIILENGANIMYLSPANLGFGGLKNAIAGVNADILYINSMFSSRFSIMPLILHRFFHWKSAIVLCPRGMLRSSALKIKPLKKNIFMRIGQLTGLFRSVRFHATSVEEERDIFRHIGQNTATKIASNFPKIPDHEIHIVQKKSGILNCVFVGRVHPIKGLDFFLKLLAVIKGKVSFEIIGPMESAEYWQQCESIINDLPPNITVTYRGEIPAENIKARLIKSHLFILPTQGENFGHAIFEAFGAARPVLISDQTPWRTLQEKKAGADIGLQHPEKWIAEMEKFIQMEQHEFDRSCVNALKLAIAFIRESDLKNKYLELFS